MLKRLTQPKQGKTRIASRQMGFASRIIARHGLARIGRQQLSLVFLRLKSRMMPDLVPKVRSNQTFWVNYFGPTAMHRQTFPEKPTVMQNQTIWANYFGPTVMLRQTFPEKPSVTQSQTFWKNYFGPTEMLRQTFTEKPSVKQNQTFWMNHFRPTTLFLPTLREKTVWREYGGAPPPVWPKGFQPQAPVAGAAGPTGLEREVRLIPHNALETHRNEGRVERFGLAPLQHPEMARGATGGPETYGGVAILMVRHLNRFSQQIPRAVVPQMPGFIGQRGKPQGPDWVVAGAESAARNGMGSLMRQTEKLNLPTPAAGMVQLQSTEGSGPNEFPSPHPFLLRSWSQTLGVNRSVSRLKLVLPEFFRQVSSRQFQGDVVRSGQQLAGGRANRPSGLERNRLKRSDASIHSGVLQLQQTRFHTLNHRTLLTLNQSIIQAGGPGVLPGIPDELGARETTAGITTVREALRESERLTERAVGFQRLFTTVRTHTVTAKPSPVLAPAATRMVFKSGAAVETPEGAGRIRLGNLTRTEANPSGKMQVIQTWVYANPADATLRNAVTVLPNPGFRKTPGVANPELNTPERIFRQPVLSQEVATASVKPSTEFGASVQSAQGTEAAVNRQPMVSEREIERIADTVLRRLERKIAVEKDRRGLF